MPPSFVSFDVWREFMSRLPRITAVLALLGIATGANAACFDVSKSEPHRLTGLLSRTAGDEQGLGYVLKLSSPICLTGDASVDPQTPISEIQVFATQDTRASFLSLANTRVTIELSPAAGKPFVARVARIARAEDSASHEGEVAVTGFYHALGRGNGDEAANFIVPENRFGPFSADAMSHFYGDLVAPLELLDLEAKGGGAFAVRYAFRSSGGRCVGRAIVNTVARDGGDFISSIQALDGC
jgi:hypothetical protein